MYCYTSSRGIFICGIMEANRWGVTEDIVAWLLNMIRMSPFMHLRLPLLILTVDLPYLLANWETLAWLKPPKHSIAEVLLALRNSSDIRMTGDKQLSYHSYGWLRFRPTWLQFLNTPKWFLFFLSQYFFTQSIVVNGVYPGSISTIEKRFGFSRLVSVRAPNSLNSSLLITFCLHCMFMRWFYALMRDKAVILLFSARKRRQKDL